MTGERWHLWFLGYGAAAGFLVGILSPDLNPLGRWVTTFLILVAGYCLVRAAEER